MSFGHTLAGTTRPLAADDAAVEWFARLRSDAVDASERARFAAWLAADARHRDAFRRIVRLWRQLAAVRVIAASSASAD